MRESETAIWSRVVESWCLLILRGRIDDVAEKRERSEKNTRKFGRLILLFSQLKRLLFFFSTDKLHVAALRVPANLN